MQYTQPLTVAKKDAKDCPVVQELLNSGHHRCPPGLVVGAQLVSMLPARDESIEGGVHLLYATVHSLVEQQLSHVVASLVKVGERVCRVEVVVPESHEEARP